MTTNTFDAIGNVTQIQHTTPDVPTPHSIASTVPRWDGELALPGEAKACPAGTKNVKDGDTTEQVESYLDKRATPSTDISGCEKTDEYAAGRELPDLDEVFVAGEPITYQYGYDTLGNVTHETETLGAMGATSTTYGYDRLSRLTASIISDGTSNSYVYDKAGNRTAWMTSQAPDTGEPMVASSAFNAAGQLTAEWRDRPDGGTSIGYSYNGAGQRTQQTASGPDGTTSSQYTYTGAGQLATVTQDDTTTRFGYDGLGRNLTTETETDWGTEETTQVWDGLTVIQQSSDVAGTATMVRDALGQVAVQSTAAGDLTDAAAWSLQDRLGSSIATTTTNGRVTDLSDYSDFGVPVFDSTGWAGSTSYTGELGDATSGLNSYFSRTYDPFAATWLSPDSYRGTLGDPSSQNRYGYVGGNPATMFDAFGFDGRKGGKSSATRISAAEAQGARLAAYGKAYNAAKAGDGGATVGNDCAGRACGSSNEPDRHAPVGGTIHGVCGGSMSFDQRPCTAADFPTVVKAKPFNCATDMVVGMSAANVARNQACAPILMDQAMLRQDPWQQDLYRWWESWARPLDAGVQATLPLFIALGGGFGGSGLAPRTPVQARPPSAPMGSQRSQWNVPNGSSTPPTTTNGLSYSGHALDQMQARGIPLSVVEDAIKFGQTGSGHGGTVYYYSPANNVRVIINPETGRIITIGYGGF